MRNQNCHRLIVRNFIGCIRDIDSFFVVKWFKGSCRTLLITSLEENAEVFNGLTALHPIGRLERPEEVAELENLL